jgi:ABC-type Zn uptake system ZnuABC Zn-binding protein ZnuA
MIEDLVDREGDETSVSKFKRMMIRIFKEFEEDIQKQVSEFQKNVNKKHEKGQKQLNEIKEDTKNH